MERGTRGLRHAGMWKVLCFFMLLLHIDAMRPPVISRRHFVVGAAVLTRGGTASAFDTGCVTLLGTPVGQHCKPRDPFEEAVPSLSRSRQRSAEEKSERALQELEDARLSLCRESGNQGNFDQCFYFNTPGGARTRGPRRGGPPVNSW